MVAGEEGFEPSTFWSRAIRDIANRTFALSCRVW